MLQHNKDQSCPKCWAKKDMAGNFSNSKMHVLQNTNNISALLIEFALTCKTDTLP